MKSLVSKVVRTFNKNTTIALGVVAASSLTIASTQFPVSAAGLKSYVAGTISVEDVRNFHKKLNLDQYGALSAYTVINYNHATAICEAKFPNWGTWGKPKVKTEPLNDWWHDIRLNNNGENNWECWDSYWSW